jgi:hypothetical protein
MSMATLHCTNCGAPNVREAAYCSSCGERMSDPAPDATVVTAPPASSQASSPGRSYYSQPGSPWTTAGASSARPGSAGGAVVWAAGILIALGALLAAAGLFFQGAAGGLQPMSTSSIEITMMAAGTGALGAPMLGLGFTFLVLGIALIASNWLWVSLAAGAITVVTALAATALLVWTLFQDMETWQVLVLALVLIALIAALGAVAYACLTEFRRAHANLSAR